jgi:hypothetical protein
MKSKSHFFNDLDLCSILDPADPSDKNYSATKVRCWQGVLGAANSCLFLS